VVSIKLGLERGGVEKRHPETVAKRKADHPGLNSRTGVILDNFLKRIEGRKNRGRKKKGAHVRKSRATEEGEDRKLALWEISIGERKKGCRGSLSYKAEPWRPATKALRSEPTANRQGGPAWHAGETCFQTN